MYVDHDANLPVVSYEIWHVYTLVTVAPDLAVMRGEDVIKRNKTTNFIS